MFLSFFFTIYAFDTQTDGRTDISLIAKTAPHRCSAVKMMKHVNN